MTTSQTLQPIKEILNPQHLVSAECENCKVRYREPDKKWCRWCIDRYTRRQKLTPEKIIGTITHRVEVAYLKADVADFGGKIGEVLTGWDGVESLIFTGNTGTGKTHAMYALLKVAIANGLNGLLVDFGQLCRHIRSAFDTKTPEQELRNKYLELDVLFLDDMGLKNTSSDYEYDVFYDILDGRICNNLSTVISSNKTADQIAAGFDKRIASRLSLFKDVVFEGSDRRAAKVYNK